MYAFVFLVEVDINYRRNVVWVFGLVESYDVFEKRRGVRIILGRVRGVGSGLGESFVCGVVW